MTGKLITFEGGEGCGKSTQVALLWKAMQEADIAVCKTREPGGSPGAERIRSLLVSGDKDAWDPLTETLLFYAARLDHVNKMIKPALESDEIVLCDRFADSTLVYQGIAKNVPESFIRSLHSLTLGTFTPDLTILLDIDPAIGLERAGKRSGDETRFESMNLEFHQSVRNGFLALAKAEPQRFAIINADQPPEAVHTEIMAVIKARIGIL